MVVETAEKTTGAGIEVIAKSDNLWKLRILFPRFELTDQELVGRMREIKEMIARDYDVPAELLEFRELLERKRTQAGLSAVIIIGLIDAARGNPQVRLRPLETPRGELIPDMLAEIDFYYMDVFDQVITMERLEREIQKAGVSARLLKRDVLRQAFSRVTERRSYIKKLEIARGEFPSVGIDAELEYTFFTDPESAANFTEYRAGRKVRAQDIVCQKIPPRNGKKEGYDVRGEIVPPIKGLDFDLMAGEGTKLSLEGSSLTALRDGVPVMTRKTRKIYTLAGERIVPSVIAVSVKPLVELSAEDILNIALEDSVEVSGDLKEGSQISSEGEIFMNGDVSRNTQLTARENILIEGQIKGGEITSDGSVFAAKNMHNATVTAGDDIKVEGAINNSTVSGRQVHAAAIRGSTIEAGNKVTIDRIVTDKSGRKTTIRVGREEFYRRKLEDSRDAVGGLRSSLERMKKLFGDDILSKLSGANQQQLLVSFIKQLHQRGFTDVDNTAIDSLKQLLQSVNPLKEVIAEKHEQLEVLQKKAHEESARKPVVVIREKIQDQVEVKIDNKVATIDPTNGPTAIAPTKDGTIKSHDLPRPKRQPDFPPNLFKKPPKAKKNKK